MLCILGCGLMGTIQRKNGNYYCSDHVNKCPAIKQKISGKNSINQLGKKLSDITKKKMSESRKGRTFSEETREKIRESNRKFFSENKRIPWNKGLTGVQEAWNKGLKKTESLEIIRRDDPIYSDFKKYRNRVSVRTKINYKLNESVINSKNYNIGKAGISNAYHVDHIISVRQGFDLGIPIEIISCVENLQVIPWLENIQKYDGKGIRKNSQEFLDQSFLNNLLKKYNLTLLKSEGS